LGDATELLRSSIEESMWLWKIRMQMRIKAEQADTTRHPVKGVLDGDILSFLRDDFSRNVDEVEWYEERG
jgi:hypothetical protein